MIALPLHVFSDQQNEDQLHDGTTCMIDKPEKVFNRQCQCKIMKLYSPSSENPL